MLASVREAFDAQLLELEGGVDREAAAKTGGVKLASDDVDGEGGNGGISEDDEEGSWDVDDDLAILDITEDGIGNGEEEDEEVVPNAAPTVSSEWLNILSHCGWGGLGPVGPIYIHHSIRNYQEEKNPLSVVAIKLSILAKKLQKSYNLTTSRKFGDAIVKLRESHLAICSTFEPCPYYMHIPTQFSHLSNVLPEEQEEMVFTELKLFLLGDPLEKNFSWKKRVK
ncbi:unnamed protein product [Caenorhabditis angaria]|uniref:Coatomer alpha subunit C-terminal domain-containing protein n=1 Tax=Caenorhabditis angaria TaxID=860376 RepID=A0A9P1MWW2_9PELO|nr:unnamed protein product [Caenorhabditis angaria]